MTWRLPRKVKKAAHGENFRSGSLWPRMTPRTRRFLLRWENYLRKKIREIHEREGGTSHE